MNTEYEEYIMICGKDPRAIFPLQLALCQLVLAIMIDKLQAHPIVSTLARAPEPYNLVVMALF
jgi:hypothetical protein